MVYCVGCGGPVCTLRPGHTVAIACRCGAGSPILYEPTTARVMAMPGSLYRALARKDTMPHLEYYLGYSDHTSQVKDRITLELQAAGSTSQRDCTKMECQKAYQRGRAVWLEERQPALERQRRIQEIGEP
ncbi:MAG: hypothetical protein Q8O40_11810 [Chloroflexota bacterium]|nr:hypothetical protein [Chloroflexota bacterium]